MADLGIGTFFCVLFLCGGMLDSYPFVLLYTPFGFSIPDNTVFSEHNFTMHSTFYNRKTH